MKTVIKLLALLVGVLLLVAIGVGLYAQFVFDPNDYRQQITAWVKQHTGRELKIQGRIHLSIFPWLAVDMGRLSLGNRAGFPATPFAQVSRITVGLRLVPLLLNRQIKTRTLKLQGLTLNLAVDKAGRNNWSDLVSISGMAGRAGNVNEEAESGKVGKDVESYLEGLAIGGVHVDHAAVHLNDQARGRNISVTDLYLDSGAILPRRSFPLKLGFDLLAKPADIRTHVQVHGDGLVEPLKGRYRIDDFHIDTDTSGKQVPGSPLSAKLRGKLLFDMKTQKLLISNAVAQAFGATATGSLEVIQPLDVPALTGTLEIKHLDLRSMINLAMAQPIITRDSDVLGDVTGKIKFDANSHHVNVSYLHAELDASIINGVIAVRNFGRPFTKFEMFIDQLDLDRYLPPPGNDTAAPATPGTVAGAGAAALPVKTLRALGIDGKVQVGALKAGGLHMSRAKLAVHASDGRISLRPEASLYGGRYRGNIDIDARGDRARMSFDESLKGIRLAPLLKDAMDSDLISGNADVHAKFAIDDPSRPARTLAGTARFKLTDGAVRGVNIARLIREAKARLEGRPLNDAGDATRETDFTELAGTLKAADGIVRNSDLTAKTPFLRLAGHGQANLVTKDVDYHVDAKIVRSPTGQGGQDLQALRGLTVPVRVTGTLTNPNFAPDLGAVVKKELGSRLKQELRRQLDKQGGNASGKRLDELKDRLRKNLDKLFQP